MTAILYHPMYAWNLVEDLGRSGVLPAKRLAGFPEDNLHQGRQQGWICEEHMRAARQMFVFAESVVLPPSLDVPISDTELYAQGHMSWDHASIPLKERSYTLPLYQDELPDDWIVELALQVHEPGVGEDDVRGVCDWWKRMKTFETRIRKRISDRDTWMVIEASGLRRGLAGGTQEQNPLWKALDDERRAKLLQIFDGDPIGEEDCWRDLAVVVERVFGFWTNSRKFARHQIPSFALPDWRSDPLAEPNTPDQHDETSEAILRFYFNQVRVPAPESADEAMRYRNSDRVIEWREKIESWKTNLETGSATYQDLRDEIEDASGYLEGSRSIRVVVGKVSPWITVPMGVAAGLLSGFPGAQLVSYGLMAHGLLQLAGAAIEASVHAPDAPRYRWFLVEPLD